MTCFGEISANMILLFGIRRLRRLMTRAFGGPVGGRLGRSGNGRWTRPYAWKVNTGR
jgi:hypothetical protein